MRQLAILCPQSVSEELGIAAACLVLVQSPRQWDATTHMQGVSLR